MFRPISGFASTFHVFFAGKSWNFKIDIKIAKFCTKVSVMVTLSIDFPFFTVNKIYRKMFELPQFEVQV